MAIDTNKKKVTLNEDASIYQKRDENLSEKLRWKQMTPEQKKKQFKEYYLRPLIVGIVIIGIALYLIFDAIFSYRTLQLQVAITNDYIEQTDVEAWQSDMLKLLKLDPKEDKVIIDTSLMLSGSSTASENLQRITANIYAEQLDIMICDPDSYKQYLSNGTFVALEKIMTPEQLSKYEDRLYRPEDKNNPDKEAYGISLKDCKRYHKKGFHQVEPMLGVVANSKHVDHAITFINWLLKE